MNSVIISDYGVMLAKTGDRLVVRGPKPKLELIEGGPQLFLPLGVDNHRPTLTVVTPDGELGALGGAPPTGVRPVLAGLKWEPPSHRQGGDASVRIESVAIAGDAAIFPLCLRLGRTGAAPAGPAGGCRAGSPGPAP